MEFRRIPDLPPYTFAVIDAAKKELRRAGADVIDLGFGNPDLATPARIVDKLAEAARNPRNHRYSSSIGIPKLRLAVADLYLRQFGVNLDPDTEVITTIGAKEGFSHLMWVLVEPGDSALVPSPSYAIHSFGPLFAGARVISIPLDLNGDFFGRLTEAYESTWPRPRVVVTSFPHNPTTTCVEVDFFERLVAFAQERGVFLVHDFAYADLGFDGYRPPSMLSVPGAKDVGVEIYTMSKSFSMAGWRVGFVVGNRDAVAALGRLKSYLDYGTFQPIQIAAIIGMNECSEHPKEVNDVYARRRDALCDGLRRIGWDVDKPRGTMFVWAPIPEPYRHMPSLDFALMCTREAHVSVSPGSGFGAGGEGFVRFALVENEQRIAQACRQLRRTLTAL